MATFYDWAYRFGLAAAWPVLAFKPQLRRKIKDARATRTGDVPPRQTKGPLVLVHAVSVGEVNATRAMVAGLLKSRPDLEVAVSATTQTGYDRARQLFENRPGMHVVRFPVDFSTDINRMLEALRPACAVLMELEVWPNFMHVCRNRSVPVLLVNGRLTETSFRNYRRLGPLIRPTFAKLHRVLAQEPIYAERFEQVGVPADRVRVVGTMKWDTAELAERIEGDDRLAAAVGLKPRAIGGEEPVLVAGSTGPGEEEHVLLSYAKLLKEHPKLRLVIVPRKPERFDAVAELIRQRGFDLVRRSEQPDDSTPPEMTGSRPAVVLGDTMGELRAFYSLADVVFVGRTLVDLGPRQHGSDMIEPAALGKPVVVGPFTGNFGDVMGHFLRAEAMKQVTTPEALHETLADWLADPMSAGVIGTRAKLVVKKQQGATDKAIQAVLDVINTLKAYRGTDYVPERLEQSNP